MTLTLNSSNRCFGGDQRQYSHHSTALQCNMKVSVFVPERAKKDEAFPVIFWLSGLTCTDENFVQKAGAQRYATEYGVAIVAPDTSPRGEEVPDDPDGAWDFGLGAGFYLNATQPPWNKHYQMYDYIVKELPDVLSELPELDLSRASIMGHSMGGHGALTIALKNPDMFESVSAFAPICAPVQCPWGQKAFSNYLGENQELWKTYDTCELIRSSKVKIPIYIDQGSDDTFLAEQLLPEQLQETCETEIHPLTLNMREGYDHSYFFIASFIGDHVAYHAKALGVS